MKEKKPLNSVMLAFIAVALLSSGGLLVRLSSTPPIATGFYRMLLSIPILYFFVYKDLKGVSFKDMIYLLIGGAFFGIDLALWNTAFHYTTIANVNLISNFVVFTMIPVAYFVFKEKIPRLFPAAILVVIIGIVVLTYGKIQFSLAYLKGDVFALICSISYAIFLLVIYKIRDRVSSMTTLFISAFSACFVLFIAMAMFEGIVIPTTMDAILPIVGLTISSQIIGIGLLGYTLPKLPIFFSSLLLLIQPILGAIMAFFVFHEVLYFNEIVGMVIVLIGIYIAKK